ncbi:MAG: hypothetical protein EXQ96_03875 [Alphaproteobacteria bacterium]|nr:hypothetical protein [Alphaproteobacteria bacterium]
MPDNAMAPSGVNHVVLNVRDMAAAHAFWTETVGFKHVGDLKSSAGLPNPPKMRFYSADGGGPMRHHDIALVENPNLPPPPEEWAIFGAPVAVNHIAISFPSRAAWLRRLEYLQARGVKFNMRVNHGMTHSLLHQRPQRLRRGAAVRAAAHGLGERSRRGAELLRGPADRRQGSLGGRHREESGVRRVEATFAARLRVTGTLYLIAAIKGRN